MLGRAVPTLLLEQDPRAIDCRIDGGELVVTLADGRQVRRDLAHYPRLARATPDELSHWRLIGRGAGLRWPDLDEDLSVAGLLRAAT
jgi:hypothetical protein